MADGWARQTLTVAAISRVWARARPRWDNSPPMSLLPHQLELLSPARDAEIGMAAIDHGADAVYIGGPAFGARATAGNDIRDLERLIAHAHRFNSRSEERRVGKE